MNNTGAGYIDLHTVTYGVETSIAELTRLSTETFSETFYDCAFSTEPENLLLDAIRHALSSSYRA
jgi:hypothetical protein